MSMVRFVCGRTVRWIDLSLVRDIGLNVQADETVNMEVHWNAHDTEYTNWRFDNATQAIDAAQAMGLPYDPSDFAPQPEAQPRALRTPQRTVRRAGPGQFTVQAVNAMQGTVTLAEANVFDDQPF
jgi:hypothetical protein